MGRSAHNEVPRALQKARSARREDLRRAGSRRKIVILLRCEQRSAPRGIEFSRADKATVRYNQGMRHRGPCACGKPPMLASRECRECHARRHQRTPEQTEATALKAKCRRRTGHLIRTGKLIRGLCTGCGATKVEAHHRDYTKPEEVEWLCRVCHRRVHTDPPVYPLAQLELGGLEG